jgi:Mg/Co/Ni transporter MgtE
VVNLRELMLAAPDARLTSVMRPHLACLEVHADRMTGRRAGDHAD